MIKKDKMDISNVVIRVKIKVNHFYLVKHLLEYLLNKKDDSFKVDVNDFI